MAPSATTASSPALPLDRSQWKGQVKQSDATKAVDFASIETSKPCTIDELIRQRSSEGPNEAIVSYPSAGIDYVDYTFRQLDVFASRAARIYQALIPQRLSSSDKEIVVGLLGPSNLEYFISILALTKLGHTVLFLSTRISTAAYVSLLQTTGAKHILIDRSFQKTIASVKDSVANLQVHEIVSKGKYEFHVAESDHLHTRFDQHLSPHIEATKISWIIHSSGSTGLPKPIFQTHRAALNNYASNLNLRGFITLPLYHAHGISSVFRAIQSRKQIYIYNATLPLTQLHLLNIMNRYDFQIFYGVPYALKILGETLEGILALASLKVVMFGGSACPDSLGDRLVDNGVNLISHYGTTETGQLMTSFRQAGDKAWDYVRVPHAFKEYISFEVRNPGIYELVALNGLPSKVASNRPDGSYATKDLFTPHPTIPNAWKYFARLDDTIVLLNGEKVNPIAFEQSFRDNKYVTEAVLFGSGKSQVGMMIVPSAASTGILIEGFEKILAPILVAANGHVPSYAQLSLDMVRILPVGTEYPRTDKGTVIRAAFYKEFESQIEEIYNGSEISTGELCLPESELREFIRNALDAILPGSASTLQNETDFFSIGVDSLQAIQLRSVLSKNIQTNGAKLSSNIVFDFPSISSLAQEICRLRTGGIAQIISNAAKIENLISKYSTFEPHIEMENAHGGQYVLVTGATGSLGAHVVSQLVISDDVKKVYCLVRASSESTANLRVIRSLRERSVYHHLTLASRKKIIALPADFSSSSLGLQPKQYDEIASDITGIIHCAWSVNFNLGLGSFEADCIAGSHNLMALCLKAQRPRPATFNFCSSVSAVANIKGGFVPEALPESLDCAQNMGYAQSKLVTEHICIAAGKSYGLRARVLRVGQVIADTVHGIWNATEAIPLMMQAGLTIGAIPRLDENPLWLPVDAVASTVVDISLSLTETGVMNIVNQYSFHWTRDLLPALHNAGLEFLEPSPREWVSLLRKSNPDPIANPPVKLLEFFARKYDNDLQKKGLTYDTLHARALSSTLATAPVLDQALVNKFVKNFMEFSWNTITPPYPTKRLIVVAGPCGAGKSTVAEAISAHYNIPWIEGDKLHSPKSIDKMSSRIPLSDSDRWSWLETIKSTALLQVQQEGICDIIVTCSALKRSYRNELRQSHTFKTIFVVLQGSEDLLRERIKEREGHFMGTEMIGSQLASLEDPGIDETDIIPIDIEGDKIDVISTVLGVLKGIVAI